MHLGLNHQRDSSKHRLKTYGNCEHCNDEEIIQLKLKMMRPKIESTLKGKGKTTEQRVSLRTENSGITKIAKNIEKQLSNLSGANPMYGEGGEKPKIRKRKMRSHKVQLSPEEKYSKLTDFLSRNEELMSHWKSQEQSEKRKFRSQLKLASLSPAKSQKTLQKRNELKKSLKNIYTKDAGMYLQKEEVKQRRPKQNTKTVQNEGENRLLRILSLVQQRNEHGKKYRPSLKAEKRSQVNDETRNVDPPTVSKRETTLQEQIAKFKIKKMEKCMRELEQELERQLSLPKIVPSKEGRDKAKEVKWEQSPESQNLNCEKTETQNNEKQLNYEQIVDNKQNKQKEQSRRQSIVAVEVPSTKQVNPEQSEISIKFGAQTEKTHLRSKSAAVLPHSHKRKKTQISHQLPILSNEQISKCQNPIEKLIQF